MTASVLGTTLSTTYVAGSNLLDVQTENWLYLLPTVAFHHVLVVGSPRPATLRFLAARATQVSVAGDASSSHRVAVRGDRGDPSDVAFRDGLGRQPLEADLVVAVGRGGRDLARRTATGAALPAPFPATAMLYAEWRGPALHTAGRHDGPDDLWLGPAVGGVHAAAPVSDLPMVDYLTDRSLHRTPGGGSHVRRGVRRALDRDPFTVRVPRRGAIRGLSATPGLPAYVRRLAEGQGVDLGRRWAMTAPGRFRSKKVVFLTFSDEEPVLRHVVKIVRQPGLNPRLDNEARALSLLARLGIDDRLPRREFSGEHSGLAVLGQSPVDGRPLQPGDREDRDWQVVAVCRWLDDLAAASRRTVSPHVVAAALSRIVDTYAALYRSAPAHEAYLREQVRRVAASGRAFPLVFQHGDPGAWNVVRLGERVTLLDWEAAEPLGIPTWDLWMFLRSYAIAAAAARGERDTLRAFTHALLEDSRIGRIARGMLEAHRCRLGLSAHLVEPLMHLCWAHRAVKEATRLPPDRLDRGQYTRLLTHCIDRSQRQGALVGELWASAR